MHYVIGDIHGCYDELMQLMEKIEARDPAAEYIFVGDFIDRGPKVWQVLHWVMSHIRPEGKYRSVRGNHDHMMLEWFVTEYHPWHARGGSQATADTMPETYYDFKERIIEAGAADQEEMLLEIARFFNQLPYLISLEVTGSGGHRLSYQIAHAFYNPLLKRDSEKQYQTNLWERSMTGNRFSRDIVVHGHTPTLIREYSARGEYRPGLISYKRNDINVDGGCTFFGMDANPAFLCAICLETLEEFYHSTPEERFLQLYGRESVAAFRAARFRAKYMTEPTPCRKALLERL